MRRSAAIAIAVTLVAVSATAAAAGAKVSYLFRLSDFSGPVPFNYVPLHVDRHHDEVYVAEGNVVRVFNHAGMEIYFFGYEPELGIVRSVHVDSQGDIWILSYVRGVGGRSRRLITRCDFRGRPLEHVELSGLPTTVEPFVPDKMIHRGDEIVFSSSTAATVVRTGIDGTFREAYDLRALIKADELGAASAELGGFTVDEAGYLVFTVPVLFRVFEVAPDRSVRTFGRPGSAPGRFGVIGGIARDRHGNTIVADKQRSVVMVFDRDFNFLTEFGYYGSRPDNLVRPGELAIGNGDRLYVTQLRDRGVSVYSVASTDRAGGTRESKEVLANGNLESTNEATPNAMSEATTAHVNRTTGGSNSRTASGPSGPAADKTKTRRTR